MQSQRLMVSKYLDQIAPFLSSQTLATIALILTLLISLFLFKMRGNKEFLYFILVLNSIFIVILALIPVDRGVRLLAAMPLIDIALFGVGVFEFIYSVKAIIKYAPSQKDAIKRMSLGHYLSRSEVPYLARDYALKYKNHRLSRKATNDGDFDAKKLSKEEIYSLAIEEFLLQDKQKVAKK